MMKNRTVVLASLLGFTLAVAPATSALAWGWHNGANHGGRGYYGGGPISGLANAMVATAAAIITAPIAILAAVAQPLLYNEQGPSYAGASPAYDAPPSGPGYYGAPPAPPYYGSRQAAPYYAPATDPAYYTPPAATYYAPPPPPVYYAPRPASGYYAPPVAAPYYAPRQAYYAPHQAYYGSRSRYYAPPPGTFYYPR